MDTDRFNLLVSLKFSGEATPEELAELEKMAQEHSEWGRRLETYSLLYGNKSPALPVNKKDAFSRHLQRLSNHLSEPALKYETAESSFSIPDKSPDKTHRIKRIFIASAAAACLLGFFLFRHFYSVTVPHNGSILADNTVSTRPGEKSRVTLPDGTQVWLNVDSRITYQASLRGAYREVNLTGEAYFDVTKDADHPFIIHTSSIDLKVLGTAFNIRAYANERTSQTTLLNGAVEITIRNNPDKKILLKPNEKLTVQHIPEQKANAAGGNDASVGGQDGPLMILSKANIHQDSSAKETLWMRNKLVFDQETLQEVALKVERWYDVKVNITEDKLKNTRYSGVFENDSLPEIMEALRITGNFQYTIHNKQVLISP